MPTLIPQPTRIQAAGTKPKLIDEYIGRVNSKTQSASVAHMRSPAGWEEPGQRPEFDEFTIVLKGTVRVKHESGSLEVRAGQAVLPTRENGFSIRLPREPSTSPFACRHSLPKRYIATTEQFDARLQVLAKGHRRIPFQYVKTHF